MARKNSASSVSVEELDEARSSPLLAVSLLFTERGSRKTGSYEVGEGVVARTSYRVLVSSTSYGISRRVRRMARCLRG
jgi:hypothetical protein